jgi:uncharacterized protein YyaL (SSP411 family)
MAHESFEDLDTAAIMNASFVNIKVDREERPDLDSIYMNAVVAMTGQGGWPMSVFLTPELKPFFGGTYFPPVRRYNMPSFREVLLSVKQAWENDQARIEGSAQELTDQLKQEQFPGGQPTSIQPGLLDQAAFALGQAYDWKFGGWGQAPKFPQPMAIEFLLRRASRGDRFALDMAVHALHSMALGGMYDVVGGGFARYSTDNYWRVPHFEKMLYDNGQLASVYLYAYLLTGDSRFRQVCEETLDFIVREMTHPRGGFFSSLDADSEGEEGKYYLWNLADIRLVLKNPEEAEFLIAAYNITEAGNFDGSTVLQRALDDNALAERFKIPVDQVTQHLAGLHKHLLRARQERVPPGTDDKVLVSWNALALSAFAEAARYLKRDDYLNVAMRNAGFLLQELHPQDRLLRSWRNGQARHNATLEDYAGFILGLLSLYQSDPQVRWYSAAEELAGEMLANFRDPQGGFFDTRADQIDLLTRPKDLQDNATPAGNSLAALALLQLSAYTSKGEWRDLAEASLGSILRAAVRYPTAFGKWLCAADFAVQPVQEIALLGDPVDPQTQALVRALWSSFRPSLVAAQSPFPVPVGAPALLADRPLRNGQPTVYVCRNFACQKPVNMPEDLQVQLEVEQ